MASKFSDLLSKIDGSTPAGAVPSRPVGFMVPTEIDFVSLDALQQEKHDDGDDSPVGRTDSWRIVHQIIDWFFHQVEVTVERTDGTTEVSAMSSAFPMIIAPSARGNGAWLTGGGPARAWPNPCYISGDYQDALEYAGDLIEGLVHRRSAFHAEIELSGSA